MRVPKFLSALSNRNSVSAQPTLDTPPEIRMLGNEMSELTGDAQRIQGIIDGVDNFKKNQGLDTKGGLPDLNQESDNKPGVFSMLKNITPKTRVVAGATVITGGLAAALSGAISKLKRKKSLKERILETLGYN